MESKFVYILESHHSLDYWAYSKHQGAYLTEEEGLAQLTVLGKQSTQECLWELCTGSGAQKIMCSLSKWPLDQPFNRKKLMYDGKEPEAQKTWYWDWKCYTVREQTRQECYDALRMNDKDTVTHPKLEQLNQTNTIHELTMDMISKLRIPSEAPDELVQLILEFARNEHQQKE